MPNSDATITRQNLIKRAFRRIGMDSPSTNEQALAVDLLNDIVKEIDAEGRWLWTASNTPTALTLVASQASYATGATATTIATNILRLERVELIRGGMYLPIRIVDKTESISTWERESGNTGEPLMVYLERLPVLTDNKMWFYPTPNSAYSAQYYYRRRLYDFDNASDNPDFPQDWAQRLVKRLAYELAPEYGVPLAERQLLAAEATQAMAAGKAANSEAVDPTPIQAEYL